MKVTVVVDDKDQALFEGETLEVSNTAEDNLIIMSSAGNDRRVIAVFQVWKYWRAH